MEKKRVMVSEEQCIACGEFTGKSGLGEDSLYSGESGPLCEYCFDRQEIILRDSEVKRNELEKGN